MALLILGPMVAEARGSIGGTVFSRNRAGHIARQRVKPVNPASERQETIRASIQNLQNAWRSVVTAAQRLAWEHYADGTPLQNRLGGTNRLTGLNMFMRVNVIRLNIGTTYLTDAPTTPGSAGFPLIVTDGIAATGFRIASVTPVIAAGDYLQILASGSRPQTRNFFNGPYTQTQYLDSATVFPFVVVGPAYTAAGQRYFAKGRYITDDARVSNDFRFVQDIS